MAGQFAALADLQEASPPSPSAPKERPQINLVELDGMVVLKIVKHCQQALPTFVTGQLLGLDIGRSVATPPPSSRGAAAPPRCPAALAASRAQ